MRTTTVVGFVPNRRTQNQFAFISLKTPEIQLTFTMGVFLFFGMKLYVWLLLKRISLRLPSQSLRFIDVHPGSVLKRFAPSSVLSSSYSIIVNKLRFSGTRYYLRRQHPSIRVWMAKRLFYVFL